MLLRTLTSERQTPPDSRARQRLLDRTLALYVATGQ
jgi:hypothetical protein